MPTYAPLLVSNNRKAQLVTVQHNNIRLLLISEHKHAHKRFRRQDSPIEWDITKLDTVLNQPGVIVQSGPNPNGEGTQLTVPFTESGFQRTLFLFVRPDNRTVSTFYIR